MKPKQLHQELFIGGHADLILIENRTTVSSGLVGCVRQLRVNDMDYDLRKRSPSSYIGDALYGLDIGTCPSVRSFLSKSVVGENNFLSSLLDFF